MKILITGGNGFVGKNLANYLEEFDNDVYISSRRHLNIEKCIKIDFSDISEISFKLNHHNFDQIFHLSAQSSVGVSFKYPFNTMRDNINSVINLLEVVKDLKNKPKVVIAGTSEVYTNKECPVTEESVLDPRSPYTVSKLSTDHFVRLMSKELGINCTLLRLFNHTGAGQNDKFVIPTFAKQLAEIKLGLKEPIIKVGNLDAERDFTDVRDVCRAYRMVSTVEEYGEFYNVCSGRPRKIKDLLDKLIDVSGVNVTVEVDPARLRPIEVPVYYGLYEKINKKFGWEPTIAIETTLQNIFNYWISELEKSI